MGKSIRGSRSAFGSLLLVSVALVPFLFNSCQNAFHVSQNNFLDSLSVCPNDLGEGSPRKVEEASAGNYESVFLSQKIPAALRAQVQQNAQQKSSEDQSVIALVNPKCLKDAAQVQQKGTATLKDDLVIGAKQEDLTLQAVEVRSSALSTPDTFFAQVEADPCVYGLGFNQEYEASSAARLIDDPMALDLAHLNGVRFDPAYESFYNPAYGINEDDEKVHVAVLDTGVIYSHPDLSSKMYKHGSSNQFWGLNAVTLGSAVVDYNPMDMSTNGHGSHVAGIVAAATNNGVGVAGVASMGVDIMAIKVFYNNSNGVTVTNTGVIVNAILWALNHDAKVINLSLANTVSGAGNDMEDYVLKDIVAQAVNRGAVVVAAAGNSNSLMNQDSFTALPARYAKDYEGFLSVGSVDVNSNGQITGRSSFSNYSPSYVEISAPGDIVGAAGVLSTTPDFVNGQPGAYMRLRGTSISTPMVSAAAAMVMSLYHKHYGEYPTPAMVENVLLAGSNKQAGLASFYKDGNVLDLQSLVEAVHSRYPATAGACQ